MARKTPTGKQKLWAEYYAVSFNASDAAVKAGYGTGNTAAVKGHENLHNPVVKEYLDSILAESRKELAITKEQLIGDLMQIKAKHQDTDPRVAITAISEINKMLGHYTPTQIETKIVQEQPLLPLPEDINFIDLTDQKKINESN